MPALSELHPDAQRKLNERVTLRVLNSRARFALAAVREMAEETGLLFGVKRDEPPKVRAISGPNLKRQKCIPIWEHRIYRPRHYAAAAAAPF